MIPPTCNKLLFSTRPWVRAGDLGELEPVLPVKTIHLAGKVNQGHMTLWKLMTGFMGSGAKVLLGGRCRRVARCSPTALVSSPSGQAVDALPVSPTTPCGHMAQPGPSKPQTWVGVAVSAHPYAFHPRHFLSLSLFATGVSSHGSKPRQRVKRAKSAKKLTSWKRALVSEDDGG